MTKIKNAIYDIYLMNLSGISIFSGCTGTEYCKVHKGQHELHTGFFSAIHSFSKEAFLESKMESMDMGNVQLNFKIDYERGIMLVLVSPSDGKKKKIKKQLEDIMETYLTGYADKVKQNSMNEELFKAIMQELNQRGILHTGKVKHVGKIQMGFDKVAEKVTKMLKH